MQYWSKLCNTKFDFFLPCSCPCVGGACVEASTTCNCLPYNYGPTCNLPCNGYQLVNAAQNQYIVCNGHGTCSNGAFGTGACTCAPSYRGAACEASCPGGSNNTCYGRGVCDSSGNCVCNGHFLAPSCATCVYGWGGSGCLISCPQTADSDGNEQPCSGTTNGVCGQDGVCVCNSGWEGVDCSSAQSQATIVWTSVAVVFIIVAILAVGGLALSIWCYRRVHTDYDNLVVQSQYEKGDDRNKPGNEGEEEGEEGDNTAENRLPQRKQQPIDMTVLG